MSPDSTWTRADCEGRFNVSKILTFQFVLCRNLCNVWEESSGHQELQTNICVMVDTRTAGDVQNCLLCWIDKTLPTPDLYALHWTAWFKCIIFPYRMVPYVCFKWWNKELSMRTFISIILGFFCDSSEVLGGFSDSSGKWHRRFHSNEGRVTTFIQAKFSNSCWLSKKHLEDIFIKPFCYGCTDLL